MCFQPVFFLLANTRVLRSKDKKFKIFKMGQHKNNAQTEIFVKFMEQHRDLARGFVKGDKVYEQLWLKLGNLLNASGPPSKEVSAWKKVWIDMRRSVKQRLAHNRIEVGKNSGERINKYVLSPHEEQLAVICGLYASVDDVKNTQSFGAPTKIINNINSPSFAANPPNNKESSPVASTSSKSARKRHIVDVDDVREMKAERFSKISCSLEEVSSEIRENTCYLREISKSIREIKKLKEKELKELTRHNYIVEKNMQAKNEMFSFIFLNK